MSPDLFWLLRLLPHSDVIYSPRPILSFFSFSSFICLAVAWDLAPWAANNLKSSFSLGGYFWAALGLINREEYGLMPRETLEVSLLQSCPILAIWLFNLRFETTFFEKWLSYYIKFAAELPIEFRTPSEVFSLTSCYILDWPNKNLLCGGNLGICVYEWAPWTNY